MDLINNLSLGFSVALSLQNLAYGFMGAVLGTLIGVLPGLGPVATIAMLLPSIYALDATPALIMLAGIYYGSQYGGSTTAILSLSIDEHARPACRAVPIPSRPHPVAGGR
jgi:TctA family transporter